MHVLSSTLSCYNHNHKLIPILNPHRRAVPNTCTLFIEPNACSTHKLNTQKKNRRKNNHNKNPCTMWQNCKYSFVYAKYWLNSTLVSTINNTIDLTILAFARSPVRPFARHFHPFSTRSACVYIRQYCTYKVDWRHFRGISTIKSIHISDLAKKPLNQIPSRGAKCIWTTTIQFCSNTICDHINTVLMWPFF